MLVFYNEYEYDVVLGEAVRLDEVRRMHPDQSLGKRGKCLPNIWFGERFERSA